MRRIVTFLTIVVLMLNITGCKKREVTEYNYIYTGQNGLWSAEYQVDATATFITYKERTSYESEQQSTLTVTYLGELDDLAKVRHFEIYYERGVGGGGSKTVDYRDDDNISSKTFNIQSSSINGMIPQKDSNIEVSITLDDEVQNFELIVKE